jgi:hypothetical protein
MRFVSYEKLHKPSAYHCLFTAILDEYVVHNASKCTTIDRNAANTDWIELQNSSFNFLVYNTTRARNTAWLCGQMPVYVRDL